MPTILIGDDHTLFRDALVSFLETDHRFHVVGQAGTGQETVARHRELLPDIVILDVMMPGHGGLETIAEIKRRDPGTKILMVTAHPEDDYAIRCLRAGADGYMTKNQAVDELIEGLVRVAGGGKVIGPKLAERMATYLDTVGGQPLHAKLSDREMEVLQRIGSGQTVSQIADQLSLSVKTVSTYRARLLAKLQLANNAELIRYALQEGLVEELPR